eukprot:scaffold223009_cov31-Tisochrysis_lutea.AAC.1
MGLDHRCEQRGANGRLSTIDGEREGPMGRAPGASPWRTKCKLSCYLPVAASALRYPKVT